MAQAAGGAGGYAQAFLGVADMLTGASADAAYEAAYGPYYKSFQGMHNAANAKVAAEANIAAIRQDKINTDMIISMQQDQAEAKALVAAAVTGAEGGSVDSVIYQTEVNSSLAKANARKTAEQQVENQLAQVYQSQSTLLALDDPNVGSSNMGLNLLQSGVQFMSTNGDQFMEGIDGLFGSSSGTGDTGIMAMNYQLPESNGPQLP